MKKVVCPHCGENTEFDDDWNEGFCLKCGKKITIEEPITTLNESQQDISQGESEHPESVNDNTEGQKENDFSFNVKKEDTDISLESDEKNGDVDKKIITAKSASPVFSIVSLVNGVISLGLGWFIIGIVNIVIGIVFGIIGIKNKRLIGCAIAGIATSAVGLLFCGIIVAFMIPEFKSDSNLSAIRKQMKAGEYDAALESADELYLTGEAELKIKYEIYVLKEEYDTAAKLILDNISGYSSMLSIPDSDLKKLDDIYSNLSVDVKNEVDDLYVRIAKAQEEKAEQERIAKEEKEKAEQERIAKEEAEKAERERIAKEEAEKAEQERIAKEETEKTEQESVVEDNNQKEDYEESNVEENVWNESIIESGDESTDEISDTANQEESDRIEDYYVLIYLDYEESKGLNYKDDVCVYVDGEYVADLDYNDSKTIELFLDHGKHKIHVERDNLIRKGKSNKLSFKTSGGDSFQIKVYESSLLGLRLEFIE